VTSPAPHAGEPESLQTSLLIRLRTSDHEAWRRLDHLYGSVVLGWCRGAGLRPEDAADVRQEVFRAVATHVAEFRRERPGDSFRGWLWRITQNKVRDHWRRRRNEEPAAGGTAHLQQLQEVAAEPSADASGHAGPQETATVFRRALELIQAEFEPRTWRAFWGLAIDGRSAAEVAEELSMSPGAVYVAKSRVLRRFREEFADLIN
jgi:RNA polymerase sigma-70 factor (ECF subfamily)